jgi:hypothetical protein
MARFDVNEFNRRMREAQRKAEEQLKREVDRVNRINKQRVDDYNRKAEAHNRKVVADYNSRIREHNRKVDAHSQRDIADLNRQLRSASATVRYTPAERQLADRVYRAVAAIDPREYDAFLSYARIDGAQAAGDLRSQLEALGVAVWFDEVAMIPGRSQSLQMDAGLRKARAGIALLTPAYLAGRFWTERELGALLSKETLIPVLHAVTLLSKETLIPVLHAVTFEDVKQYSGIPPDLSGFSTASDSIPDIAKKIAAAILVVDDGSE